MRHPSNRPSSAAQSAGGFGPHSPPEDLQARLQGAGRANIRKAKFRFFAPAISLCDSRSQMQSRRFSYSSPYKRTAEGENGGRKSRMGFSVCAECDCHIPFVLRHPSNRPSSAAQSAGGYSPAVKFRASPRCPPAHFLHNIPFSKLYYILSKYYTKIKYISKNIINCAYCIDISYILCYTTYIIYHSDICT